MAILGVLDDAVYTAIGADDPIKGLYKQNSETKQWFLDIAPDEAAKLAINQAAEVERLKKHNAELLDEKKKVEAEFKPFKSFGKTAEELAAELAKKNPDDVNQIKSEFEKQIEQLKASSAIEIEKAEAARKAEAERVEAMLVQSTVDKLRVDYDLNETAPFVLKDFLRPVRGEDGQPTVQVFENGQPALVAMQPKTPTQLIEGWREQKQFLSIFNVNGGGGMGSTQVKGKLGDKRFEGLSATERLKEARKSG